MNIFDLIYRTGDLHIPSFNGQGYKEHTTQWTFFLFFLNRLHSAEVQLIHSQVVSWMSPGWKKKVVIIEEVLIDYFPQISPSKIMSALWPIAKTWHSYQASETGKMKPPPLLFWQTQPPFTHTKMCSICLLASVLLPLTLIGDSG